MAKILIVDDEENLLEILTEMLKENDYEILTTTSGEEALQLFKDQKFDLVLSDIRMKEMDGIELLVRIKGLDPDVPMIIMTAYGSVEDAVRAMKKGAFHYLIKPIKMDELNLLIQRALSHKKIVSENKELKIALEDKHRFKNIVGESEKMKLIYHLIEKIAATDSTVLITGDSGTGKELVAKALHYNSLRKNGKFVAINCAALPETLLESELFGHVKGAFTGAVQQKEGLFSVASGGTIFLDEISSTSSSIQSKLLRVLQEKEIKKVGDTKTEKVDVRIIAATNVSLEEQVKKREFREDLFYRLSVIPIHLPPLRERKDDIPLLVEHFLKSFAKKTNSEILKVQDEVLDAFMNYSWPGNIRELENIIERMVMLSDNNVLSFKDLPPNIKMPEAYAAGETNHDRQIYDLSLKKFIEKREAEHIQKVLERVNGDKKQAAEVLKIDLATLYRKMDKLGLKRAG